MPRPRKPPRLQKRRGRPYWFVVDGRQVRSTETADRAEAERWLAEYIAAKTAPPDDPTIEEILKTRMRELRARPGRRADNVVAAHKHLAEAFGNLRPKQITPVLVTEYHTRRGHYPSALREDLIELKTALNAARNNGWIDRVPPIKTPAKTPPREHFMTQAEARSLLVAAKPLHLRLFIIIAMASGARKGAILGLTWDRVDLNRGRIDFTDPKRRETKKRRTVVPIGEPVMAALRDARSFARSDYVIEFNGKPIKDTKTAWNVAVEEAGLPDWVSPHVLKHSVISWLAEDGFSVDQIADMTATHPTTIRRVYRKFSPDYLKPMAETLSKNLSFANMFAKPVSEVRAS